MKKLLIELMILFLFSGIYISNQLYLYQVFAIILTVVLLLSYFVTKRSFLGFEVYVILFLALVLFTMLYRGTGFYFLGEDEIGGMFYVKIIISAIILIMLPKNVLFEESKLTRILSYALLLGLIPFVSDVFYFFSNGNISFDLFIHGSTTINQFLNQYDNGSNFYRIQSGAQAGIYLFLFGIIKTQKGDKFKYNSRFGLFSLITIILIGLSGHRIAIINLFMIFFVFIFLTSKKDKRTQILKYSLIILVIFLLIIIPLIKYLPDNFQRVFSFIPDVKTTSGINQEAEVTITFRIAMWYYALGLIPQYWLIGKGLAVKPIFATFKDANANSFVWFTELGTFHNGPLGAIINFGILGIILIFAFFINSIKILINKIINFQSNKLKVLYIVFLTYYIVQILTFIFLYGDMQTNFPEIIFTAIILKLLFNSSQIYKEINYL